MSARAGLPPGVALGDDVMPPRTVLISNLLLGESELRYAGVRRRRARGPRGENAGGKTPTTRWEAFAEKWMDLANLAGAHVTADVATDDATTDVANVVAANVAAPGPSPTRSRQMSSADRVALAQARRSAHRARVVSRRQDKRLKGRETHKAIVEACSCPITRAPFRDPVFALDGYTYEREAIEGWLTQGNGRSPMTRVPLSPAHLYPNRAVKDVQTAMAATLKSNDGAL